MIVNAGHLDVGNVRATFLQIVDDVMDIQQSFMIFCRKANRHHDNRRGTQVNQVLSG